jgi:nicotinic acetylcholine receptor
MLNELNLVSPSIGSILWTPFVWTMKTAVFFVFTAWALPNERLSLSSLYSQAELDYFHPHSDWTLLEYSTVAEDQGSNVDFYSFKIKIKRRVLYYGVMVIAPTVLFALLNPLVFLLPVESGERVGLVITILLYITILM